MTREEQYNKKLENESKRIEETKLLVNLFLESFSNDEVLSQMTGISKSTVGRRLIDKDYICKAFPINGEELYELIREKRQENKHSGNVLGGQTTLLNHAYTMDESGKLAGNTKLRLDCLYKHPLSQYKFLLHAALTFRLHLDTLSSLFQIDEQVLSEELYKVAKGAYESLNYLFLHDGKDQLKARDNFLIYYRQLLNAIREKDEVEKKRLLEVISDAKVIEFKKNHKLNGRLSDDDILTLVNYQLKYALYGDTIEYTFDISRKTYQKRVNELLENYPEIKREYE